MTSFHASNLGTVRDRSVIPPVKPLVLLAKFPDNPGHCGLKIVLIHCCVLFRELLGIVEQITTSVAKLSCGFEILPVENVVEFKELLEEKLIWMGTLLRGLRRGGD